MIPTLRTPSLILTPFERTDTEDLFSIRGDPEAMRFWDWPGDSNVEQTRKVAAIFETEMREETAAYWTARRPDGMFVGVFDLSELDSPQGDVGFMVVKNLWGQGYGTEGVREMIAEASRRGITTLKARIHAGNEASRRLLKKLGFDSEGPSRPLEVMPGRVVLCEYFSCSTEGDR